MQLAFDRTTWLALPNGTLYTEEAWVYNNDRSWASEQFITAQVLHDGGYLLRRRRIGSTP